MHEMRIITRGSELMKIGAGAFMEFFNPFVKEKTFLMYDKTVTLKEEEQWLRNTAKEIDAKNQIKIVLFADGKLAGSCDIRKGKFKERHNVHFGLAISKEHRGKGYGEMLLRNGIKVAEKHFKPHRMWIEHTGGNEPAGRLYKKVGFAEVARLRDYVNHFGEWRDKILMEYRKR